nr:MAG TPA: hypothetical protein [Caudoviricetes sp.]
MIVCKSALVRSIRFKYITKSPLLANAGGGLFLRSQKLTNK